MLVGLAVGVLGHLFRSRLMVIVGVGAVFLGTFLLPLDRVPLEIVTETDVTSFAKALALGEIHEELVFPYPLPRDEEAEKVRGLIARFRDYAAEHIDSRAIDEEGWIDDQVYRDLGELGLMGLYVPRGVRRPGPVADRLRARVRGDRAGRRLAHHRPGRAPVDRLEGHRAATGPTSRRRASCPTWRRGASSPASR